VLQNFARADWFSGRLTPCAGNSAYATESELVGAVSSKSAAPCGVNNSGYATGVNKSGYAAMVTGFSVCGKEQYIVTRCILPLQGQWYDARARN